MKRLTQQFIMTLLLLMVWQGNLMAITITKYLRADFGAIGDGVHLDDSAFVKATHFFNNLNYAGGENGELIIEYNQSNGTPATYLVGIQLNNGESINIDGEVFSSSGYLKIGIRLLNFESNINGMTIHSDIAGMKSKIKYRDSLYFGAFCPPNYKLYRDSIACSASTCIQTTFINNTESAFTTNAYCDLNCNTIQNNNGYVCDCDPTANIHYQEGFRVDSFENTTNQIAELPLSFLGHYNDNYSTACAIGNFITIINSKNLTIKDIEIDGNSNNQIWGSTWGDKGIQLGHRGIIVVGNVITPQNIIIENVYSHHMGLDGIELASPNGVTIINSEFDKNARQGMSWTGGKNITANNSKFNNTGKAGNSLNGKNLGSSPLASLDIEPEGSGNSTSEGFFNNCEFSNSVGCCVVNDANSNITENIKFSNCTFNKADGGWGLWTLGKNFEFENCNVNCSIVYAGYGLNAGEETKFIGCHFNDRTTNGINFPNGSLFAQVTTRRLLFKDCDFNISHSKSNFMILQGYDTTQSTWNIIDNCTFNYHFDATGSDTDRTHISCVKFRGNNKFNNTLNTTNSKNVVRTTFAKLEGSNDPCNPYSIELNGQTMLEILYSGALGSLHDKFSIGEKANNNKDGFANFILKNSSFLHIYPNEDIEINSNSSLVIDSNSSLFCSESTVGGNTNFVYFNLQGKLIAKPNSFLQMQNGYISSNNTTNSLLFVSNTCNANNNSTASIWGNAFIPSWKGLYPTPYLSGQNTICIDGGHSNYSTNIQCHTPAFNKITTSNSLSILYNVTGTNLCDKDVTYKIVGASSTASALLDGTTSISNSTQTINLSQGVHTISVTDNGCNTDIDIEVGANLLKLVDFKNISCSNETNGFIKVNAPGVSSYTLAIGSTSQTSSTGEFLNLGAGTYTITVSSNGCIMSIVKTMSSTICCDANYTNTTNNKTLYDNINSWSLGTNNISNQNILVNGTLTIDNNMSYTSCHFYFTANAQIIVNNYNTLTMNNCTLKSACGDYWNGIIAESEYAKIVLNGCTIQDMSEGVLAKNNATLKADGNTFLNNTHGVIFENMNDINYSGYVRNNTFKSDNAMLLFNGATVYAVTGVSLLNCSGIKIGNYDIPSTGNKFEHLLAGINILNIEGSMNTNTPLIELYNNSFKDIHNPLVDASIYPEGEILNQCYNNGLGSAILINGNGSAGFQPKVIVKNKMSLGANNSIFLEYCDKAILSNNTNLNIQNLKMNNNLLGIMCGVADGKTYTIDHNQLYNTFIGIQVLGDVAQSNIVENKISSPSTTEYIQRDATHVDWPVGIDVRHYNNNNLVSNSTIKYNTIDIKSWAGMGINLSNTNATTNTLNNNITLSSTNFTGNYYHWFEAIEINNPTEPSPWLLQEIQMTQNTTLAGINVENAENSLLSKNTITGQLAMLNATREDATAISIEKSKFLQLQCNTLDKTRFGITAKGDCETNLDAVKGNTMNNHILGWAFRHFGGEGTLGNVGSNSNDNNNNFIGSGYASKVFRFCTNNSPNGIMYTNNLISSDFNSVDINNTQIIGLCNYDLYNPLSATLYTCPSLPPIYNVSNNSGEFNLEEAIQIINNTRSYAEFEEICHWLDVRELFDMLDANPSIRNSNAQLQSFYTYLLTDVINQLKATDNSLNSLINVFATNNDAKIQQAILDAKNKNNAIDDTEVQNHNEQEINGIYLNLLENGLSAITADDIEKIETMANSCPMVKGTAVYKARTLNALFNPTQGYDDLKICNSQGVYKTSGTNQGYYSQESNYLQNLQAQKTTDINHRLFSLFPNPAQSEINIKYELKNGEEGSIIIYDIYGRKIKEVGMLSNNNILKIELNNLTTGIYTYKYLINNITVQTGKIIIE